MLNWEVSERDGHGLGAVIDATIDSKTQVRVFCDENQHSETSVYLDFFFHLLPIKEDGSMDIDAVQAAQIYIAEQLELVAAELRNKSTERLCVPMD